jgi:hypothetical protein
MWRELTARPFAAIMLAAALALMAGCGGARSEAESEEIPEEVRQRVARIGEEAATSLRTGLSARLTAALADGGAEAAIDVCAGEALPLTDSIAAASQATSLKRTSLRIRNPRNAPDAAEREALEWFGVHEARGERPAFLVERSDDGYRYYSPLRMAAPCTTCHGPRESLAEGTRAALEARYPADEATGYTEGELRGLIRVSVPAGAVED